MIIIIILLMLLILVGVSYVIALQVYKMLQKKGNKHSLTWSILVYIINFAIIAFGIFCVIALTFHR